jgi:signal transduction histidine kinase
VVTSILAGQLSKARNAAVAGQAEARALQEELLRVSDDERRRIGHDLHDGLGQQLTGVALLSKVLGKRLAERQMPEEAAQAEQISTLAAEMVGQAKHLARGLDPVPVQPDGLIQALSELCDSASRIFHVNCDFFTDIPSFPCEPRVATHLFRIAQEGVSNAIKHGGARTIRVQLQQEGPGKVLSVRNDGKPFRPAQDGLGMGLRIMRHRSTTIGATLDIGPAADNQTLLVCRFGYNTTGDKAP